MSKAAPNSRLVALIVASALFMELLDGTIIAVALPAMAESFATDPVVLTIGITSYLMTLVVVIPASGWLADRFGTRSVFALAIAGFTIASFLCGISETLWEFTAARIGQGACAALMSPVGRLAVITTAKKTDLIKVIALITWPALLAPVIGPPLGGFIAETWSWRLIFFINVPIGLVGTFLVLRYVPNHRSDARRKFDIVGFVLSALALASLLAGVELVTHGAAGWVVAAFLTTVGVIAGIGAIRHVGARTDRLIDLSIFRVKTFATTTLHGGLLFRMTGGALPYLLPLFFQLGFGLDAFSAGLMVLAYMFGNIAMKVITTPVMARFGFRRVLIFNGMLAGFSILACVMLEPVTPIAITAVILFLAGCFRSMQLTCLNTLMFADIGDRQKSSATTLSAMIQQLAIGLGVALSAMVLNMSVWMRGGEPGSLGVFDFHIAFAAIAAIAFASIVGILFLAPTAGADVSGHRHGDKLRDNSRPS